MPLRFVAAETRWRHANTFRGSFRAAVRQRSRWVTGIALQGWQHHGWRGALEPALLVLARSQGHGGQPALTGGHRRLPVRPGKVGVVRVDRLSGERPAHPAAVVDASLRADPDDCGVSGCAAHVAEFPRLWLAVRRRRTVADGLGKPDQQHRHRCGCLAIPGRAPRPAHTRLAENRSRLSGAGSGRTRQAAPGRCAGEDALRLHVRRGGGC